MRWTFFSPLSSAALLFVCSSCANVESIRDSRPPERITACQPGKVHVSASPKPSVAQSSHQTASKTGEQAETNKKANTQAAPTPAEAENPLAETNESPEGETWHEGMTLSELEQIALQNNPTLALAGAEVEKERGRWTQIGLYPNPTLGYVQSDATRSNESHTNGMLIQQTFITADKLEKNRNIETYGIQNTQWQLEAQQMRVLTDVRLRYFDVIGSQQQVELVEAILKLTKQSLEAAQALFKGQQVPETDVLQAETQLAQVELALDNARAEHEAAWRRLTVIIGQPDMPVRQLVEPDVSLPELNFTEEWERLVAASPQLRSTEAQVGIAHRQLIRDQATPIPDVTVQVVGQYDRVMDYGTVNALIALPVPFFDRNQGQIYTSSQELYRASKEVERVQLVLRDQLTNTYRNYVQAKNEATRLQENVLPKLQKTLDLTIEGYRQGQVAYPNVLVVQDRYLQTSLNRINALTRARQIGAEIDGLQLTGGLNPATIGTAIQEAGGGQRRAVQQALNQQNQGRLNTFAPAAID